LLQSPRIYLLLNSYVRFCTFVYLHPTTKKYNKITISIDLEDKLKIEDYAKKNNISVSALVRNLLKENNIL